MRGCVVESLAAAAPPRRIVGGEFGAAAPAVAVIVPAYLQASRSILLGDSCEVRVVRGKGCDKRGRGSLRIVKVPCERVALGPSQCLLDLAGICETPLTEDAWQATRCCPCWSPAIDAATESVAHDQVLFWPGGEGAPAPSGGTSVIETGQQPKNSRG